jgi:lipid-binding SYLF domain-containing protein
MTYALDPGIRGIPKTYFMNCAGIVVMSCVQAGFMFSGTVGTGIFMKRDLQGQWSNPVACGMAGMGVGIQIGATVKDVVIFLPDDESVQSLFSKGVTVSAQSDVTVGVGREFEGGVGGSGSGMSAMISMAYTKGAFLGASMEGAVVSPRRGANEAFYGPGNGDPDAIIEGRVLFPFNKVTMMDELRSKLDKLSQGLTEKIGEAEKKKAEQAAAEAEKAADIVAASSPDIVRLEN